VIDRLAERFARGEADLREVYEAHGGLVYAICRRTLDGEAAKDVSQEVFVSAWRGRDQFDPERGALAAWLVGITKRRVIDHVRHHRRHDDRRADLPARELGHDDAGVERVAQRMLVADALTGLPDRARQIIELAYLQDLTHQEIAERTGVPLGTIKSDIRRGLVRIREQLRSDHERASDE
jgi:RNA polymerase sigma-70 factor (ECF subfamily)